MVLYDLCKSIESMLNVLFCWMVPHHIETNNLSESFPSHTIIWNFKFWTYNGIRGAFNYNRWWSGQMILVIWLVKNKSLSIGFSHQKPTSYEQCPPKRPHGNIFCSFWHQELNLWRRGICQRQKEKFIQTLQFVYVNGLLPCPDGHLTQWL